MWCQSIFPPCASVATTFPLSWRTFLNVYSEANDRYVVHIQKAAMEALQDYHWPGNVRELQNYVERAVVMAEGDELTSELLPDVVLGKKPARSLCRAPSRSTSNHSPKKSCRRESPPFRTRKKTYTKRSSTKSNKN